MSNTIINENENDKLDDGEWQSQERAMRGGVPLPGDMLDIQYRLIARALREPPSIALGEDFAKQVVKQAIKSGGFKHKQSHFERNSLCVLGAMLISFCVITLITCGDSLHRLFDSRLGTWGLALMMCALLTQTIDSLQRQFHSDR